MDYLFDLELDIRCLIEAVKFVKPLTKDGEELQDKLLDILYRA
jgi:hypothetical protein